MPSSNLRDRALKGLRGYKPSTQASQLGALAQRKKDLEEALKATQVPPKEEATPPASKPATEAPKAPAKASPPAPKPKPVEQMPKDELDALRLKTQQLFEEKRRRQEEEAAKGR